MDYPVFIKQLRQALYKSGDFDLVSCTNSIVVTEEISTMATNGSNIFINPNWVDSLTIDEVVGVLWHELLHDLFHHHSVTWAKYDPDSNISPSIWHNLTNISMDIVINDYVKQQGKSLPKGGAFRESLDIPSELDTSHKIFKKLLSDYKAGQADKVKNIQDAINKMEQEEKDTEKVSNKEPQEPNSQTGAPISSQEKSDSTNQQQKLDKKQEGQDKKQEELDNRQQELDKKQEELDKEKEELGKEQEGQEGQEGKDKEELGKQQELDKKQEELDKEKEGLSNEKEELDNDSTNSDDDSKADNSETNDDTSTSSGNKDSNSNAPTLEKGALDVIKAIKQQEAAPLSRILQQEELFDDTFVIDPPVDEPYLDQIFKVAGSYLSRGDRTRSYHRPNRRQSDKPTGTGLYPILPGHINRTLSSNIAFYIDVSGSMYWDGLDRPNTILAGIREHMPDLLSTSSIVYPFNDIVFEPLNVDMEIPQLGGGTDINKVIAHINKVEAELFVILTDADEGSIDLTKLDESKQVIFVIDSNAIINASGSQNIEVIKVKRF